MTKKLILSLVLLSALLFTASPALAQFGLDATAQKAQYGSGTDIYSTISTVISLGLSLAGIVFLAIMFYAGLRWMTARGNEEFIEKAKNAMFAAIIGFIIVTVSYGLSTFIFSRLIK
jgi:hypothetical protein